MKYAEVCAGIHASGLAWPDWTCAWVAEIDPFACAVLEQRAVGVPNLGDMTKITDEELQRHGPIDLLMGGTPCQSFSVAGLRKGLADPRGNLALAFLALAQRTRARWLVWENVPGVLSSTSHDAPDPGLPDLDGDDGPRDGETFVDSYDADEVHAFACFLAGLRELGYGFAYASLDAQFFGLAQRRERVFLVAHLGEWAAPAAVLLERESLRGNPPPSREAGQDAAGAVARSLRGRSNASHREDSDTYLPVEIAKCLEGAPPRFDSETETFVTHALTGEGFDASEDGTGRGTPLVVANTLNAYSGRQQLEATYVPIAFHVTQDPISGDVCPSIGQGNKQGCGSVGVVYPLQEVRSFSGGDQGGTGIGKDGDPMFTLHRGPEHGVAITPFDTTQVTSATNRSRPEPGDPCHPLAAGAHAPAIAFSCKDSGQDAGPLAPTLRSMEFDESHANGGGQVAVTQPQSMVRRLTPTECERLMGFPDGYTLVTYRSKPACDGPRYRAIGNSIAAPPLAWIGKRIEIVDAALCGREWTR